MTIKDVAKAAGVSKSTVSRYLNNGYVSKENREKIQIAIRDTGFEINVFARGLKTKRSKLIAIIIPRLDSYTTIQTLKGTNQVLSDYGYQMVIVPKTTIEEDEISYLKKVSTQGFDGIIVLAHAITQDHINLAQKAAIPILFTGQKSEDATCIVLNDTLIGSMTADYVNTLPGQRVLYLSVPESDHAVGIERKRGFVDACTKNTQVLTTDFRVEDAYRTMLKDAALVNYDIIVAATDNIALGAMRFLREQGISVPQQVQVIGIGNYEFSSLVTPRLTTLSIDYVSLGINAANTMMTHLKEVQFASTETIHYTLIERESTQSRRQKKSLQMK